MGVRPLWGTVYRVRGIRTVALHTGSGYAYRVRGIVLYGKPSHHWTTWVLVMIVMIV